MKKAFIGKGMGTEYLCFTRYTMTNGIAKVHSDTNKYDVTHYVKQAIANWIGERVGKIKEKDLSDEEFGQLIGNDFNKLVDEIEKIASQSVDEQGERK